MKEKEFIIQLGIRIREARKKQNLTQNELADLMGKTQNSISAYENGTRSMRACELPAFAKTLNISIEELLYDQAKPINPRRQTQEQDFTNAILQNKNILSLLDELQELSGNHNNHHSTNDLLTLLHKTLRQSIRRLKAHQTREQNRKTWQRIRQLIEQNPKLKDILLAQTQSEPEQGS